MDSLSAATAESFHLLFSGDPELWVIIFTSFSVSLRAILIAVPVAFVVAFLMAHLRYPGRRAMIAGFSAMQSIPAVVIGLTVYLLLYLGLLAAYVSVLFYLASQAAAGHIPRERERLDNPLQQPAGA